MKPQNTDAELDFYIQQAKQIQGGITVSVLQRELKVGYQKAQLILNKMTGVQGLNVSQVIEIKTEPEAVVELDEQILDEYVPGEFVEKLPDSESKELAIVEAACQPMNLVTGLREVIGNFELGDSLTMCKPKEGVADTAIGSALTVLTGIRNWTELGLGDLINELEDRGWENVIPTIISHLNLEDDYTTLSAYARTARAVPNDLRELPKLRYSHLQEVATSRFSKDPEEQKKIVREVLAEASEKGLNVSQTREACLNKKGKSTTPTPLSGPPKPQHGRYIIVYGGKDCQHSFSTDQIPDPDETHTVIDTLENLISCGCCGGVPSWIPLPKEELEQTANKPTVEEE